MQFILIICILNRRVTDHEGRLGAMLYLLVPCIGRLFVFHLISRSIVFSKLRSILAGHTQRSPIARSYSPVDFASNVVYKLSPMSQHPSCCPSTGYRDLHLIFTHVKGRSEIVWYDQSRSSQSCIKDKAPHMIFHGV